jgi:pseudouridine kinase
MLKAMTTATARIACVGAAAMDRRVQPEGELRWGTSNPVRTSAAPGGVARNIAETLARLGCRVALFSVVGSDRDGERIVAGLKAAGVELDGLRRAPGLPTASYTAVLDQDRRLLVGLADMLIFDQLDLAWADRASDALQCFDLWIVDANLPAATLARLLGRKRGQTVLADPVSAPKAPRLGDLLGAIDMIFPDRAELAALSGRAIDGPVELAEAAAQLRRRGTGAVVVTLGGDGVYLDDREDGRSGRRLPALAPRVVRDITGAGDALIAGCAYGLIHGESDPIRFGLAAASLALESELAVPQDLGADRLRRRARLAPALGR